MLESVLVHHAGSAPGMKGAARVRIWSDQIPTEMMKMLYSNIAEGIEGIVLVVNSQAENARVELVFDPEVKNPNASAGRWIDEVNTHLSSLSDEDLDRLITSRHDVFSAMAYNPLEVIEASHDPFNRG